MLENFTKMCKIYKIATFYFTMLLNSYTDTCVFIKRLYFGRHTVKKLNSIPETQLRILGRDYRVKVIVLHCKNILRFRKRCLYYCRLAVVIV